SRKRRSDGSHTLQEGRCRYCPHEHVPTEHASRSRKASGSRQAPAPKNQSLLRVNELCMLSEQAEGVQGIVFPRTLVVNERLGTFPSDDHMPLHSHRCSRVDTLEAGSSFSPPEP